ncbi:fibrinogen-like protein 1 [Amphibalanus amphitrite]|uniref:fibrinogen-like protein 1 n=1 Tax=Amphibalanus amphitrite TaxID=1232801 RepID=UPI001C91DD03|nr:fibrinogen-like protein 1 [Amphibalanus amphitrite]
MAVRPLGSSVCLLALLCAVLPCALADDAGAGTNDALDDLLALVNSAVREAVDPISAELRSHRGLLNDILGRLSSQDARTDQLSLRLDQLNVRLDQVNSQSFSQLDSLRTALSARLDSIQEVLESQNLSVNTRLDSMQDAMESQNLSVNARLTSMQDAMESQNLAVDARLHSIQNALQTKPQTAITRLDSMQDALESQFLSVNARLDSTQKTLESQLQPVTSQLDSMQAELGSQLTSSNSSLRHLQSELDTALDSVTTRLDSFGTRLEELAEIQQNATTGPRDCSELPSGYPSGVYALHPGWGRSSPVEVFCDMETDGGGWTVFQRREDILPREDFYRNWTEYKYGFGDLTGEFWMGLEKLWLLTGKSDRRYELRVDLGDFDGEKRYARYENFRISSELDGYRVTGGSYTGNAGDSMAYHFGQKFSTRDKDQDKHFSNCARDRESGWWFKSCDQANLNGVYLSGEVKDGTGRGVAWDSWRGQQYSLKSAEMKIRPYAARVG